jgi:hypothetical protein
LVLSNKQFPLVFQLGLQSFVVVGILIIGISSLFGPGNDETPDRLIFVFSVFVIGVFLVLAIREVRFASWKYFWSFSGLLIIFLGIFSIENKSEGLERNVWLGFGPTTFLLSVLISQIIFSVFNWDSLARIWRFFIGLCISINIALVIPSIWQDSKSVIDLSHSEYVLNELLAPAQGRWPYSDFVPQYQTFYGFLLEPFSVFFDATGLSNISFLFLTLLGFLAVGLGVYLAHLALEKRSLILATGLVVPLTTLTQFPVREGYSGSIAALLSALPIRIFPGILFLTCVILLMLHVRRTNGKRRTIGFVSLGLVSGILVWHSQDFGIAASLVAIAIIVLGGSMKPIDLRALSLFSIGLIPSLSLYPIASFFSGRSINFDYILFFSRQFGGGFGSERISVPGPILIVLPLIATLVVVNGYFLYKSKPQNSVFKAYYLSSLIGFTFSLWSLAGFVYYLNRSFASGQLQILLLPIAISLAAVIGIFLRAGAASFVKGFLFSKTNFRHPNFWWAVPFTLIFSLPLASLIHSPNPVTELNRIYGGADSTRWPTQSVLMSMTDSEAASRYANSEGLYLGYFGNSSSYISSETGVEPAGIFNSPTDLWISEQSKLVACEFIRTRGFDALVLSDEGANMVRNGKTPLCGKFVILDVPGVRSGHFVVLSELD